MEASNASQRVLVDRSAQVRAMLDAIRALPVTDKDAFFVDARNRWTAEACLRRALEALLDMGRHILAKEFAIGVSEYKEIATQLREQNVLTIEEARMVRLLAGYRNRLVHFYHEITADEIYEICAQQLPDVEHILGAYLRWLQISHTLSPK